MTSFISHELKWVIVDKELQHVLFYKSEVIFQGFYLLWSGGMDCGYKLFYNSDLDLAQRQE